MAHEMAPFDADDVVPDPELEVLAAASCGSPAGQVLEPLENEPFWGGA